jgi:hypothetical protein
MSNNIAFSVDALIALEDALDEVEKTTPLTDDERGQLRGRAIGAAVASKSKWPAQFIQSSIIPDPGVSRESQVFASGQESIGG